MTEAADRPDELHEPPDVPAYKPDTWRRSAVTLPGTVSVGGSRAELAADQIARVAAGMSPGERIGSKDDIRRLCRVSVGTVNEAIKLAQERGTITSRPGPGGGIFALDPSPLSRMNGWFRSATRSDSSLAESIRIRDALAPLLVDEALAQITEADQGTLDKLMSEVRRTRDRHDISGFVWAAWDVHEHFAGIGRNSLLDSLYLSVMDVGTSHLRARLEGSLDDVPVWLDGLAGVVEDLVDALRERNATNAVDALRRTDPTMILRAPDANE
ncbi:FadR/GntR family transcriptional regulator [Rhodococcus sp. NPDC127528]|uniref:FadR/GntR family transcriptional regulator n=1 Tax=unclassified Rhodococcus (in: high G+C Gram-positive bacteria) TaxID=192944 RepID=UPI0036384ECB